ncbi:hypothetical protein [Pyramidobacter sp.]|uniref:hypothetical protein n=1 Tax=Pyramidobacter sp. TaxID=1943581 RepID=UPI003317D6F3
MAIPYTKPHLSFCEQVSLLEERGMIIKDRKEIETLLTNVGYYHMSAYWYPYRKENSDPACSRREQQHSRRLPQK